MLLNVGEESVHTFCGDGDVFHPQAFVFRMHKRSGSACGATVSRPPPQGASRDDVAHGCGGGVSAVLGGRIG